MRKIICSGAITIGLTLSGCASLDSIGDFGAYETGTAISQEQLSSAIAGTSKRQEISKLYGQPNRKDQVGVKEIWYYDYNKIRTVGSNISEATVFEFDKKGILIQHYKTNKSGKTGNALIDAANN